ncbi:hypothetical protein BX666DRAFT_2131047 [Dichotomocladium elegans]|nr:hypothetical protein BX666DRAFT_2131047 [Dichotomocladium elegans]
MLSSSSKHTNLKIESLLCPPTIVDDEASGAVTTTTSTTTPAVAAIQSKNSDDLPFLHMPLPPQPTATAPSARYPGFLTEKASPRNSSGVLEMYSFPFAYHRAVKAKRKRASPWQTAALEEVFKQTEFPSSSIRCELGLRLGMTPRTIQIWFQNKRQATKRSTTTAATTIKDDNFHAGYQGHRPLYHYRQAAAAPPTPPGLRSKSLALSS